MTSSGQDSDSQFQTSKPNSANPKTASNISQELDSETPSSKAPTITPSELEKYRDQTPALAELNHLLACGSALMPDPVLNAIKNHLDLEASMGGYRAQKHRQEELDQLYVKASKLVGARESTEIAFCENSTMAWAMAFYSLGLKRGDRILTCQAEYGANYVAMLQVAKRLAIKVEVVPNDEHGQVDLNFLEAMVNEKTRLIAMTWIPTNGGLVNPARQIGEIAERYNLLYMIDACQVVGQMPVDILEIGCDILSTTGRKWLRGPRGIGFLYVRKSLLETMEPVIIDHFSAEWIAPNKYELRDDARRFETWENAYALRLGLGAAIDYANDVGIDRIQQRSWALAQRLRDGISQIPGAKVLDLGEKHCAIVSFSLDSLDPREVVQLAQQRSIVIGTSERNTSQLDEREIDSMLRCAPHYYNTESEIDDLLNLLTDIT